MSRHLLLQVTGIKRGQLAICRHRQENARPRFARDCQQTAATADVTSRPGPGKHCKHYPTTNTSANFPFLPENELFYHACPPRAHMPHLANKMTSHERIYAHAAHKQMYNHQTRKLYKLSASRPECGRNLPTAPRFRPRDAHDAPNWQYYNTPHHSIHDQRS